MHSLYEFCYRTYIQRECHSVLAKLHPITLYMIVFLGSARAECHFLSNTRMLVTFGICLNNTLILGIFCFTFPHLPGCFCLWSFFENIGFNTVLTDPVMSHLATQLGYSAGEFQALQLIVCVWCRGLTTCLLHVGPPFGNRILNNSWAVGVTEWIINLIFCVLTYAII